MGAPSVEENLKRFGLKVSGARVKIYEVLLAQNCALTAEELYRSVGTENFDFSTIYRNLNTFVEKGLVQALHAGDGAARFELLKQGGHHHHHLICRRCQKIEVINKCFVPKELPLRSFKGFRDISHRLEFEGLCPSCSKKNLLSLSPNRYQAD